MCWFHLGFDLIWTPWLIIYHKNKYIERIYQDHFYPAKMSNQLKIEGIRTEWCEGDRGQSVKYYAQSKQFNNNSPLRVHLAVRFQLSWDFFFFFRPLLHELVGCVSSPLMAHANPKLEMSTRTESFSIGFVHPHRCFHVFCRITCWC